ncbi:MAG TPA: CBS domain-containing protein [Noviherbaspirillum sp.]|uniref:CBS domain-containing protein n=1 Tax=Noviherbaspirillum sp. TaxID=1926288 RepID=UPI002D5860C4|nr:CBS domain-containing protein [Noviherbaspirillum sp.]HYD94984.1 CBS domain-containing protein [Noviherbaspirillum sp.]
MQMISEVMTRNVQFVSPHENLQRAAQMMDELNVGALPVCEGDRLVGMVTDRDITVRGTAAGRPPAEAHVEEVMSTDVRWCFEDQPLDDVMQQMSDTQIRRIPVVTHDDAHRLVGIVSLGDLVTKTADGGQRQDVEQVVAKISSPSEPDRSQPGGAAKGAPAAGGTGTGGAGSDTGTATGFAGADALGASGRDDYGAGDIGSDATGAIGSTAPPVRRSAAEGTAGTTDNTGGTGAPGGTDATGVSGASGGTAGTGGSAGTGVGAKP